MAMSDPKRMLLRTDEDVGRADVVVVNIVDVMFRVNATGE